MNSKTDLLIIGDVHGKVNEYLKLIKKHEGESIQLGDFGFKKEHRWHMKEIDGVKHKVSFGNHDDTTFLPKLHSLGNFSYRKDYRLMTVRGAWSIDQQYRTEGKSYWADEELNYYQMERAINLYEAAKPEIVVSHDCPHDIRKHLFGIEQKSITCNGLQQMLDIHSPNIWVFGHHHKSIDEVIGITRFICLNELDSMLINKKLQYKITLNPPPKYESY